MTYRPLLPLIHRRDEFDGYHPNLAGIASQYIVVLGFCQFIYGEIGNFGPENRRGYG